MVIQQFSHVMLLQGFVQYKSYHSCADSISLLFSRRFLSVYVVHPFSSTDASAV